MRRYAAILAAFMGLLAPVLLVGKKRQSSAVDEQKRALHALSRLTSALVPETCNLLA